jgi:ferredoxin
MAKGSIGGGFVEMASPKKEQFSFPSFDLTKPGLVALLFRRSFLVGIADYMFHIGLYGSIITGAITEIANFIPGFAGIFDGLGWLISWTHGVTGVLLVVGGLGFVTRYFRNKYFKLAYGKLFYLDLLFMLIIAITGTLQALAVFGLIQVYSFVAYPWQWAASIHVSAIYVWIVVSLFLGGAVRHALATVVWRFTSPEKTAIFTTFSDACGSCGRCLAICPRGAPILTLRRYARIAAARTISAAQIKSLTEELAGCRLCGICTAACPFSFNFVDFRLHLISLLEGHTGRHLAQTLR